MGNVLLAIPLENMELQAIATLPATLTSHRSVVDHGRTQFMPAITWVATRTQELEIFPNCWKPDQPMLSATQKPMPEATSILVFNGMVNAGLVTPSENMDLLATATPSAIQIKTKFVVGAGRTAFSKAQTL
jgi:hypothetical protein